MMAPSGATNMNPTQSGASSVFKFPVVRSEQGGRVMYVASLSHACADKFLPMDIDVDPMESEQRAYDAERAVTISEYVAESRVGT